jgi:NADH-quinone oxidoreductase subunit G
MPKVKVNDVEIEVPAGTNMIEAARLAGVEIPHYCYHPHLSIAGNCRMCMCEAETPRGPMLEIACNMQAREGLAIRTDSEKVKAVRKSVMEFLLVNHPLDCPICDQSGECRLQDYYMEHGKYDSRGVDPKVGKHKRQDIGEHIVLDAERCVECSRCVRFGDEVTGTGDLRLMNRGDHTEIGMFPGTRLEHNYQGNLADICPVGALTSRDFRFQRRVWYLRETDSVCTGCATGCNTRVCHQEGEVFRTLPRRNDDVNKSWMCDPGRESNADVGTLKRILRPTVDGKPVADGWATLAARIRAAGPENTGFVLGTQASLEANWALLQVVKANCPTAKLFWVGGNDADAIRKRDDFLMDGDKNPNTAGVRLLAAWAGNVGDADALRAADLRLLVVLEDDVVTRLSGNPAEAIAYFGTHTNPTAELASIVIPVAHVVEMDATYVNRQGRVQRARRATNPLGQALPAYQAMDKLGGALGRAPGTNLPTATFAAMAAAVPRMKGLDYKALGAGGRPLLPEPTPEPAAAPAAEAK